MTKLLVKSIIGFREGAEALERFYGINPENGQRLEPCFSTAPPEEVELTAQLALDAFLVYQRKSGREREGFLREIAANIELMADELIERTC